MRAAVLALALALPLAALAAAPGRAECELPGRGGIVIDRDTGRLLLRGPDGAFLRCLLDENAALRRDLRRLRDRVGALEAELAATPAPYADRDGRIEAVPGRPVGSAVFVLTARATGRPASLPLDHEVVRALCGRSGGCRLALAEAAEGLRTADPALRLAVGPCAFSYDAESGGWARAEGCSGGTLAGVDGDGAPPAPAAAGSGGAIIATAGRCALADAAAQDAPRPAGAAVAAELAPDRSRGLFLLALPAPGGSARFRCELSVD
jgi:hypothetical protein